tara:strand:+ start:65 stop:622 length:558 start_codon:yes stop_codon:yes gene_type:complete
MNNSFSNFFVGENINKSTYKINLHSGAGGYMPEIGNKLSSFFSIKTSYYFINIIPFFSAGTLRENDIIAAISNKHLVGYKLFSNKIKLNMDKNINTYNKMSYFLDIPVGGYDKYNPHYCRVNDIVNLKIFRMHLNGGHMSEIVCNSLELSLPNYLSNSNFIVNNTFGVKNNIRVYTSNYRKNTSV